VPPLEGATVNAIEKKTDNVSVSAPKLGSWAKRFGTGAASAASKEVAGNTCWFGDDKMLKGAMALAVLGVVAALKPASETAISKAQAKSKNRLTPEQAEAIAERKSKRKAYKYASVAAKIIVASTTFGSALAHVADNYNKSDTAIKKIERELLEDSSDDDEGVDAKPSRGGRAHCKVRRVGEENFEVVQECEVVAMDRLRIEEIHAMSNSVAGALVPAAVKQDSLQVIQDKIVEHQKSAFQTLMFEEQKAAYVAAKEHEKQLEQRLADRADVKRGQEGIPVTAPAKKKIIRQLAPRPSAAAIIRNEVDQLVESLPTLEEAKVAVADAATMTQARVASVVTNVTDTIHRMDLRGSDLAMQQASAHLHNLDEGVIESNKALGVGDKIDLAVHKVAQHARVSKNRIRTVKNRLIEAYEQRLVDIRASKAVQAYRKFQEELSEWALNQKQTILTSMQGVSEFVDAHSEEIATWLAENPRIKQGAIVTGSIVAGAGSLYLINRIMEKAGERRKKTGKCISQEVKDGLSNVVHKAKRAASGQKKAIKNFAKKWELFKNSPNVAKFFNLRYKPKLREERKGRRGYLDTEELQFVEWVESVFDEDDEVQFGDEEPYNPHEDPDRLLSDMVENDGGTFKMNDREYGMNILDTDPLLAKNMGIINKSMYNDLEREAEEVAEGSLEDFVRKGKHYGYSTIRREDGTYEWAEYAPNEIGSPFMEQIGDSGFVVSKHNHNRQFRGNPELSKKIEREIIQEKELSPPKHDKGDRKWEKRKTQSKEVLEKLEEAKKLLPRLKGGRLRDFDDVNFPLLMRSCPEHMLIFEQGWVWQPWPVGQFVAGGLFADEYSAYEEISRLEPQASFVPPQQQFFQDGCYHADTCPMKLKSGAKSVCHVVCGGHHCRHFDKCSPQSAQRLPEAQGLLKVLFPDLANANGCLHVPSGPNKCPMGLVTGVHKECNTICGGHHCSHYVGCKPQEVPLKQQLRSEARAVFQAEAEAKKMIDLTKLSEAAKKEIELGCSAVEAGKRCGAKLRGANLLCKKHNKAYSYSAQELAQAKADNDVKVDSMSLTPEEAKAKGFSYPVKTCRDCKQKFQCGPKHQLAKEPPVKWATRCDVCYSKFKETNMLNQVCKFGPKCHNENCKRKGHGVAKGESKRSTQALSEAHPMTIAVAGDEHIGYIQTETVDLGQVFAVGDVVLSAFHVVRDAKGPVKVYHGRGTRMETILAKHPKSNHPSGCWQPDGCDVAIWPGIKGLKPMSISNAVRSGKIDAGTAVKIYCWWQKQSGEPIKIYDSVGFVTNCGRALSICHQVDGKETWIEQKGTIEYNFSSYEGNSGAPVVEAVSGNVIAIHQAGTKGVMDRVPNSGIMIRPEWLTLPKNG